MISFTPELVAISISSDRLKSSSGSSSYSIFMVPAIPPTFKSPSMIPLFTHSEITPSMVAAFFIEEISVMKSFSPRITAVLS